MIELYCKGCGKPMEKIEYLTGYKSDTGEAIKRYRYTCSRNWLMKIFIVECSFTYIGRKEIND